MYLILEYAPNGNLKSHLDRLRTAQIKVDNDVKGDDVTKEEDTSSRAPAAGCYDPNEIIKFAYEISCGMEYLSSQDVSVIITERFKKVTLFM